jgi:hypothetical protein
MQFLSDMKQYALQIIKRNNSNTNVSIKFAFNEVFIFGFNFTKFDINLLVKYLCIDDYKIESTVGKSIYYICLKVSSFVYTNEKPKK